MPFYDDKTTQRILSVLSKNARISWQALGKEVFLTPQAVAVRVNKLVEDGVIGRFTITQPSLTQHFITVFMNQPNFAEFETVITQYPNVTGFYKITGEGCYHIVFSCKKFEILEEFLQCILTFGRYKISSTIRQIK